MIDEEEIMYALASLMPEVRWRLPTDDPSDPERQFKTVSRRVKLFNEVSSAMQPACYQAEHIQDEVQKTNMPYKTTLMASWVIYQDMGNDPKALPTIMNNCIIKGVRTALMPKVDDPGYPDQRNTLGGLVHHCYIEGRIYKDPGDIDNQGMIVIPIKLLVP